MNTNCGSRQFLICIFGFMIMVLSMYTLHNVKTMQLSFKSFSKISVTTTLSTSTVTTTLSTSTVTTTLSTSTVTTPLSTSTVTTTLFTSTVTSTKVLSELLISGLPLNSTPNEAFVTFCNNNPTYLHLLSKVLDCVHQFSTRPIIVFGIDVDLDINTTRYPRVIKRRLNQTECGPSIYFCKIHAIIESKLDYGIYIEADTLVNWNVDILFDMLHRWPYSLPLAPRHPDDPKNYYKFLQTHKVDFNSRKTPYIHAHILWNYRAYPFFRQARTLMRQGHFMGANFDETGMNVLLWKANANHTLCKIDPYFSYLPAYESNQKTCEEYCHTAFIFIHGSKSHEKSHDIFERLKNRTGSPFIQTSRHGFHYLNETQYTCCYSDSRPSPIHPLLCQHT